MKDILIKYPIKILQQELINIRTNYRLEKKKLIEILRTMKSIKKLTKEQLVDLLIENKVDISKLPKLEDLEKPIKKEGKPKISTGKNQSLTRKQLEEMKLKSKPKEELPKELLDLYKTIEINLKEVIRLSNNIYEKSQPYYSYSDRGYINDIQEAEEKIKENPRLINIKKQLIDYYISVEKTRKKLNDEYDNFIEDVIDYYELSPYRFNFLVAYLNSKTNRKSYIDELLIEIFEGKRKNEDYYYNDEFNNYIFEIGKVRVKENDIMTYNAIQEKRIVPITQDLIKKEIIIFISKFLEQLDYDNIQDFYDNNKDLFVPNLKLYEKFIKAFKLKTDAETFITQTKEKYNYQIIQDFKIKSEEEIIGTKKTQKKETKIETNIKPQISTGKNKSLTRKQLEEMKLKSETEKAKIDKSNMTFEIFKNPTTDQLIKMKNDLKNNEFEWIKKALNEGLTETRILEIADFSKQDYKLLNAFFTPKNIIEKMIDNSLFYENVKNFKSQKKVLNILEPTGGTGNIIISILDSLSDEDLKFIKVDFVEINKIFFNIARVKLDKYKDIINFYNQDFLKFRTNTKYDYIFANPPYMMNINKNRIFDVDFFNKCWDMLDFKIVILMSPSSLVLNTNSHNKFIENLGYSKTDDKKKIKKELENYGMLYSFKQQFTKDQTQAGITNIETYLYVIEKDIIGED